MPRLSELLTTPATPRGFHQSVLNHWDAATLRRRVSDRAAAIAEQFPEIRRQTLDQAQLAIEDRLLLPGTGAKPYFVGNPPKWHENPVNDPEYVFALNRMFHWRTLLAACTFTGDERYANKVVDELRDWIASCPRPALIADAQGMQAFNQLTPWRALETGIRMYESWPWIIEHLLGTDLLSPDLLAEFATSCHEHAEVLARISPLLWPKADHNHYLMENLGLLTVACTFPQFREASAWQKQAIRELERCAAAQLTEDGGQIEGCPHYHNGCVYWFCLALHIAARHGLALSGQYKQRVGRALDYSVQSFRPSGTSVPWGDSDADRTAISNAGLWAYISMGESGPLRTFASLIGAQAVRQEMREHVWHIPDLRRFAAEIEKPAQATPPRLHHQRELKQVMLRTSWDREALSVFFAARSPVNNGHAHIDPMGFDFTAMGRSLVVDPGRFTYRDDQDRRAFKSASFHNTLTIDEREPFEYRGAWGFTPQKEAAIMRVTELPNLLAAEAMQRSFEPAIHRRLVALVDNAALLVLDRITGLASAASVQIYYHLDSTQVSWDSEGQRACASMGDVSLQIATAGNLAGTLLPGRVSDLIDVARESTRLRLEDSGGSSDRTYAALLVPYRATDPAPATALSVELQSSDQLACTFTLNGRHRALAWSDSGVRYVD